MVSGSPLRFCSHINKALRLPRGAPAALAAAATVLLFFPGISHAAPQYSDCLGKLLQQDNGVWLHWGNASIGDLANLQALDDRDTDSHSDFLWRNAATGDIVVWRMVDLGLQDSAWLGNPGGSWQIFAK